MKFVKRKPRIPVQKASPVEVHKSEAGKVSYDAASFLYSGSSPVVTSRKSHTPLRIEDFGTVPDLELTDRDKAALDPLRQQFGRKPFPRGNLDTGILNRAIRKGLIQLQSGSATSTDALVGFVK